MKKIYGCLLILGIFVANFIGITTIFTAIISNNLESNTRIVTDRLEKIKNKES